MDILNFSLLFALPGGSEWLFIILAIIILFGGKKIPELMRGVGKGVRELDDAKKSVEKELDIGIKEKDKPKVDI